MHVLIATDGTLEPDKAAAFATALAGEDGSITVMTAVEINRNLLRDLRELFGERPSDASHQDAEYVGMRNSGASIGADWPGDDAMLERYLADQKAMRTGPLVEALKAAGITPDVQVREGEAAAAVMTTADEVEADVICVGPRGGGLFDGFLGSTSTKLARRSPTAVLIIR